ncbi:MAG: hypothetical protein V4492_05845 [Chlamydiota bacterium]
MSFPEDIFAGGDQEVTMHLLEVASYQTQKVVVGQDHRTDGRTWDFIGKRLVNTIEGVGYSSNLFFRHISLLGRAVSGVSIRFENISQTNDGLLNFKSLRFNCDQLGINRCEAGEGNSDYDCGAAHRDNCFSGPEREGGFVGRHHFSSQGAEHYKKSWDHTIEAGKKGALSLGSFMAGDIQGAIENGVQGIEELGRSLQEFWTGESHFDTAHEFFSNE